MPAATKPRPANAHEARAIKAQRIVDAILADAPATVGALRIVLSGLRVAPDATWETIRAQAGVNPPSCVADRHLGVSLETRRAVLAIVAEHIGWLAAGTTETPDIQGHIQTPQQARVAAAVRMPRRKSGRSVNAAAWFYSRGFGGAA